MCPPANLLFKAKICLCKLNFEFLNTVGRIDEDSSWKCGFKSNLLHEQTPCPGLRRPDARHLHQRRRLPVSILFKCLFSEFFIQNRYVQQINGKNVHQVSGAGTRTRDLFIMSRLPEPLDQ